MNVTLMGLVKRYGPGNIPRSLLYQANCISRSEFERRMAGERLRLARQRAEEERRRRQDAMAEERAWD